MAEWVRFQRKQSSFHRVPWATTFYFSIGKNERKKKGFGFLAGSFNRTHCTFRLGWLKCEENCAKWKIHGRYGLKVAVDYCWVVPS